VADQNRTAPPLATSRAVTTVFEELLAAVHRGELQPGQRISDAELAQQYGVSRTPVREALQRLREIGIIEASPSRFTRVAVVTPAQTIEALVVWVALYRALLEEVIPRGVADALPELEAHHAAFVEALGAMDTDGIATTNFQFFSVLPPHSTNAVLQRGILGVVHIVRLGSLHLPDYIDFAALTRAQQFVIDAVRTSDLVPALEAMRVIGSIRVPVD
jgi:DNA-binding GntR family transcriptional regulator